MIKFLLFFFLMIDIYADTKQEMLLLYQNKKYKEVCDIGLKNLAKYLDDEDYMLLYGFGCLKSDNIDRLSTPITMLKHSKEARANSAYFSVILMQKKLLLHALVDGYNLSSLHLPTTKYPLSKVFELYSKLGKHPPKDYYFFEDPKDKRINYKLYVIVTNNKEYGFVLEEYYNGIMTKKHIYK
ncbi:FIG00470045: hypothetical protein [hydrothermal vent metagenome]|uniref:Uncharacterized protein n=1 Tax=hydrothermal vent metagenome TaxID=652676 RepID=A0A1W1D4Z3_9ZZZZ